MVWRIVAVYKCVIFTKSFAEIPLFLISSLVVSSRVMSTAQNFVINPRQRVGIGVHVYA